MKRSEMISAIANHSGFVGGKIGAEDLLQKIETMGMLPPEYYRPKNYGTGHEMTYSQWIQLSSKIREWESE
jgi:hypothetical protein